MKRRPIMTFMMFVESLNWDQKQAIRWHTANRANSVAAELTGHIFPGDRHIIPLEPEDLSHHRVHPAVENHLAQHGFEVTDHVKGLAKDKYGRQVRIGKILNKTRADKFVVDRFINDDARRLSTKKHDYHVVISRHPEDVAGMSTGKHWESCMTMGARGEMNNNDGGEHSHDNVRAHLAGAGSHSGSLRRDLDHGTHVAYLTHKDDHDVETPVARIALKPFQNVAGGFRNREHTILRPENRVYGDAPDSFEKTVKNWAEKHFPVTKGIYTKHPDLYDDDGQRTIINPDMVAKSSNKHEILAGLTLHPNAFTGDHVKSILVNHPDDEKIVSMGIGHPHLDADTAVEHATKLPSGIPRNIMRNKNLETKHLETLLDHPGYKSANFKGEIYSHPKMTSGILEKQLTKEYDPATLLYLAGAPKTSASVISKLQEHPAHAVRRSVVDRYSHSDNLGPEHIKRALADSNVWVRMSAAGHSRLPYEVYKQYRTDPSLRNTEEYREMDYHHKHHRARYYEEQDID